MRGPLARTIQNKKTALRQAQGGFFIKNHRKQFQVVVKFLWHFEAGRFLANLSQNKLFSVFLSTAHKVKNLILCYTNSSSFHT